MANKTSPQKQPAKKTGIAKFIAVLLLFSALIPFSYGYLIIIVSCLVPSFIAFITDTDPKNRSSACILSLNIAGILPILISLFKTGQSLNNVIFILSNSATWFIVLGSCTIGLFFFTFIPILVAFISKHYDQSRILKLQENKKFLEARWGKEILS